MPFVARECEASTLLTELDRACSGHGRVVIITGEPGSGKTNLVRRFVERSEDHAARPRAILTRCHSGDDANPYAPWHQLTATYPTLENRLPQPIGEAEPAAQGVAELGRRVASVLVEAATGSPLIIVFHSIELADESSRILIRALAQRVPSAPVLLILTLNAPHRHSSQIAGWLNTLVSGDDSTLLDLEPIELVEISHHIDTVAADQPPAARRRISQALATLSGGNLLVLNNLLTAYDAGEIDLLSDDAVERMPASLGDVVATLAGQLSPKALEVLSLAAIVGMEVDLNMLAELRATTPAEIAEYLDAALSMGLLIEDVDGAVRFQHGAFQQALARQQPPMRRRLLHAAILDWLRKQPGSRASAIARHAERSGDLVAAYAALLDAAQVAREDFGFPEAARLYQRAIVIGDRIQIADEEEDKVRLAMADVLVWNDRGRGTREIDRVATRARLRGDALMLARSAQRRATMLYEDGDVSGCLTILTEAIPILRAREDIESLASALTYLGYCYGAASRFRELEVVAQELAALGERSRTPMYQAVAYQFLASQQVARGTAGDALGLAIQCVDIAEELGRYDQAADYAAVGIVVGVFSSLDDPTRMKALLERGEALVRLRSDRLVVPDAPEPAFVQVRFLYGDWDAVRAAMPALEAIAESSPRVVRDMICNLTAELALAEGRIVACELALDEMAPRAAEGTGNHAFRTWLSAAALRLDLCLTRRDVPSASDWADAIELQLESREFAPGYLALAVARGKIALARGDARAARTAALELQARARVMGHRLLLIQGYLLESQACRASNDSRGAGQAATAAVTMARNCELPYMEAQARVERGRALLAAGDDSAAREDLVAAGAIFTRLGAAGDSRAVDALMAGARPANPAGLTEREMDVLRLVAQGLADRQIADQLFISHRTVTTHVGNLLGKTQTANRTELAIWALRHDITGTT